MNYFFGHQWLPVVLNLNLPHGVQCKSQTYDTVYGRTQFFVATISTLQ